MYARGVTRVTILLAACAALAAGCAPEETQVQTQSQRLAGDTPLRIVNATGEVVCYVYVADDGSQDEWGEDWLGRVEIIAPRAARELRVAPGEYQVKVERCGHTIMTIQWDVSLAAPLEAVLHEGTLPDDPPPEGYTRVGWEVTSQLPESSGGESPAAPPTGAPERIDPATSPGVGEPVIGAPIP